MSAGSFIADAFSLLGCDNGGNTVISETLPYAPKGNYNSKAFISGIKTEEKKINTKLSDSSYNSDGGKLSVKLSANGLQNIHISYVLWKSDTSLIFKSTDLSQATSIGDYEIIHSTEFKDGFQNFEILSIQTARVFCKGSGCKASGCLPIS